MLFIIITQIFQETFVHWSLHNIKKIIINTKVTTFLDIYLTFFDIF